MRSPLVHGWWIDAVLSSPASGDVELKIFDQASIQFDTATDSPPTASTNTVNLWQLNLTALIAERFFAVSKVRDNSVAIVTGMDMSIGFSP